MFSHSNISVDVAKCGVWKFHKFTQYTHFLSVTKSNWTIYSGGKVLTHEYVLLCLKTNYMKKLFSQDKSFFVTDKEWLYWVNLWKFSTLGDVYTDVGWLSTTVVCFWHKRTYSWVKTLPRLDCSVTFCNRQKVSVLGEFMKLFSTFGDVYTEVGWLNTYVVSS